MWTIVSFRLDRCHERGLGEGSDMAAHQQGMMDGSQGEKDFQSFMFGTPL